MFNPLFDMISLPEIEGLQIGAAHECPYLARCKHCLTLDRVEKRTVNLLPDCQADQVGQGLAQPCRHVIKIDFRYLELGIKE